MAVNKPGIPKGTRDFSPVEMAKRNYIFNIIKEAFGLYGFMPLETPAMENLSTLMGKYGEEGDRLLFKILNSGDFIAEVDENTLQERNPIKIANKIAEKGLRYDLTVPFARYVVQHRNELQFPFKRYQMQPVWRADRPQKGRYREFYQCDADIIGSTSLNNEVELIMLIDRVFSRLGIKVLIKLNNRKILSGIATSIGQPDKLVDITVAIDKIDKIGKDKVVEELKQKELPDDSIQKLIPFLEINGSTEQRLALLETMLANNAEGTKGIEETRFIINSVKELGLNAELELDVALARGLNYYTGAIIEVKALDVEIGSITGGGRYDNLTGIFGLPDVSGVGISFGADRIYDVLTTLNLFPDKLDSSVQIMFVNFGEQEALQSLKIIKRLRDRGVSAELYPDEVKLKRQLSYAADLNIDYVGIIGEEELKNNTVTVKDMRTGTQTNEDFDSLLQLLKK